MTRHAELLQKFFIGRPDAYALQQPDGDSYVAVRKPLTLEVLEKHVAGRRTDGTYLVTVDGKARCGVYDYDEKSDEVRHILLWLRRWFHHWAIELLIEPSGSKGYHGWVITKQFVPACKLIKLLELALRQLEEKEGMGCQPEVFPKQSVTEDLGSLIKLPWGIHCKTGKRTAFVDEDFSPLPDWGASLIEGLPTIDESMISEVLGEYPGEPGEEALNDGRVGHPTEEIVDKLGHVV